MFLPILIELFNSNLHRTVGRNREVPEFIRSVAIRFFLKESRRKKMELLAKLRGGFRLCLVSGRVAGAGAGEQRICEQAFIEAFRTVLRRVADRFFLEEA